MDYLVPTAMETPKWETGHTVTAGRFALDQPATTVMGALLMVASALANASACRRVVR